MINVGPALGDLIIRPEGFLAKIILPLLAEALS